MIAVVSNVVACKYFQIVRKQEDITRLELSHVKKEKPPIITSQMMEKKVNSQVPKENTKH